MLHVAGDYLFGLCHAELEFVCCFPEGISLKIEPDHLLVCRLLPHRLIIHSMNLISRAISPAVIKKPNIGPTTAIASGILGSSFI